MAFFNKKVKVITPAVALADLQAWCAKCERAESQVAKKLKQWEVAAADAEQIIQCLIDDNFLNEERFIRAFIRDKFEFNKWGRSKIKFEIQQVTKQKALVAQVLEQYLTDDLYKNTLKRIARYKYTQLARKETDSYAIKRKMAQYLMSKGFESELIWPIVETVLLEGDDPEDL